LDRFVPSPVALHPHHVAARRAESPARVPAASVGLNGDRRGDGMPITLPRGTAALLCLDLRGRRHSSSELPDGQVTTPRALHQHDACTSASVSSALPSTARARLDGRRRRLGAPQPPNRRPSARHRLDSCGGGLFAMRLRARRVRGPAPRDVRARQPRGGLPAEGDVAAGLFLLTIINLSAGQDTIHQPMNTHQLLAHRYRRDPMVRYRTVP
jgi:hypothetical protein